MNKPDHGVAAIQRLAFGGIANPTQRAVLRGSDATYLTARQRELDAFEEQRQSYNTALQDFQTNVYEPYKAKSAAYNTAAEKYNTDVYNPYKTQFDAYTKAVEEYNAGPRTADYAGPAAPTLASEFTMTAPTSPTAFAKEAPVLPFEVTDVETHQKAAAKRAVQDASDRAVAIDVVSDPGRFNFGSMSVSNRFMAEGGEVEDDLKGKTARSIVKDFKDYGYSREEIEQMANEVSAAGRGGDELLAYLSPESVRLLKANGGSGSINPITGLPEFKGGFLGSIIDKLSDAFSDLFGNKGQPAAPAPAPADPTPAARVPVAPAPAPAPTGPTAAELAAQLEAANKKYADDMAAIREQQAAAQKLAIENALKADAEARAKAALPMSKVIAASSTGAVAKPTDPYTIPPSLKTVGAGPVIPSLDLKGKLDPSPPSRYFDRPVEDPNKSPYTPIVNRPGDTGPTAPYNPISQPLPYQTKGVGAIGSVGPASSFFDQPASDPNNFFATTPQTSTGLAPGTAAIGPADMPLYGAKNTMSALGSNPNLSPGMLGGQQNAGYRTDRLGNRIYSPGAMPLYGFAKGGDIDLQALLAQNTETLSDNTPEEVINTDPLGTAQKMMADFSSVSQTNPNVSPVRKAIKRTKPEPAKSGNAKMAYESLVKGDLGAMGTSPPKLQDTDSAQAQMRELARIYQLKAQAAQDRARGLSADTFGAPTLGQPTLTKGKLTKRRFNKGGEAKKSGVIEDIGRWLKNNDINPSDFLAALGRTGSAAGTALSPSTLNEGEDAELARRRAMPPTVDRSKGSPEGGEAKKPEAESAEEPSIFGVKSYATDAAARMFPGQMGQDDQRDAARHMLAAAIMAKKFGPSTAEFLGKAHERFSNPKSFFNMLGIGEPRYDYELDTHNNRLGAELASRTTSQAELEKLVRAMALQSQDKQVPGKPWIMTKEQLQAVDEKNEKAATPPQYRAEGSPEEGELSQEEIDAASRPAFVTSSSGKGRKEGEISKQLRSGDAYVNMAKGVTELPYDIAGAPMDLVMMARQGLTGQAPAGQVGTSDYIKQKMTGFGIRPDRYRTSPSRN